MRALRGVQRCAVPRACHHHRFGFGALLGSIARRVAEKGRSARQFVGEVQHDAYRVDLNIVPHHPLRFPSGCGLHLAQQRDVAISVRLRLYLISEINLS